MNKILKRYSECGKKGCDEEYVSKGCDKANGEDDLGVACGRALRSYYTRH